MMRTTDDEDVQETLPVMDRQMFEKGRDSTNQLLQRVYRSNKGDTQTT